MKKFSMFAAALAFLCCAGACSKSEPVSPVEPADTEVQPVSLAFAPDRDEHGAVINAYPSRGDYREGGTTDIIVDEFYVNFKVSPAKAVQTVLNHPERLTMGVLNGEVTKANNGLPERVKIASVELLPGFADIIKVNADLDMVNASKPIKDLLMTGVENLKVNLSYSSTQVTVESDSVVVLPPDLNKEHMEMYDDLSACLFSGDNAYALFFLQNVPDDIVSVGGAGLHDDLMALRELDNFTYGPDNAVIAAAYDALYDYVNCCNFYIERFSHRFDTLDTRKYIAEAKVMRAWGYMQLLKGWGERVVLPDEYYRKPSLLPSNEDVAMSSDEAFKLIAKEVMECLPYLVTRDGKSDKEGAKIATTGFAYYIAGMAYLYARIYDEAGSAFEEIEKSGKYDLVPGDRFKNLSHIEADFCEEMIMTLPKVAAPLSTSTSRPAHWFAPHTASFRANPCELYIEPTFDVKGYGCLAAPQTFGDEFFSNDGHSYRFDATVANAHDMIFGHKFEYADAGLNDMSEDELVKCDKVGISDTGNGLYGNSFWIPLKFIPRQYDFESASLNLAVPHTLALYDEVLLYRAEAYVQSGKGNEAKKYLNMIQKRANSKTISTDANMEFVQNELRFELWGTGNRWFDILRWNDAKAIATLEGEGMKGVSRVYDKAFRGDPRQGESATFHPDGRLYTVWADALDGADYGFKKGKHELFPFPSGAKWSNRRNVQNPGYED
ncbi:MAG: RagB/SusD family nutrient uptake outer membrane protein [Bacteroidales bacterium]|nr:RagB/SusD family nutrient uptake outer membrane protein [Bacteroidales bacterium]